MNKERYMNSKDRVLEILKVLYPDVNLEDGYDSLVEQEPVTYSLKYLYSKVNKSGKSVNNVIINECLRTLYSDETVFSIMEYFNDLMVLRPLNVKREAKFNKYEFVSYYLYLNFLLHYYDIGSLELRGYYSDMLLKSLEDRNSKFVKSYTTLDRLLKDNIEYF